MCATVGAQLGDRVDHCEAGPLRVKDHVAGPGHPGVEVIDVGEVLAPQVAKPAVEVTDAASTAKASERGQKGVPEGTVCPRHRGRSWSAVSEAITARAGPPLYSSKYVWPVS